MVKENNTKVSKQEEPKMDIEKEQQQRIKQRIKQLQKEKYSDVQKINNRLDQLLKDNDSFNEEDTIFIKMLGDGWGEHLVSINKLKIDNEKLFKTNQQQKKKSETLSTLCKQLQKVNKDLKSKIDDMKVSLDEGLKDVRSKISLYEEENERILEENKKLREALQQAADFNSKRQEHVVALKNTNDFLRKNHEEMDRKYQKICEEYAEKYENLGKDHEEIKQRYCSQISKTIILEKRIQQESETRDIMKEFDEKYTILRENLDISQKHIDQYKQVNEKLMKQNTSLRNQTRQATERSGKLKNENKTMKKQNQKLQKSVGTLKNLSRELQNKLKALNEQKINGTTEIKKENQV